VALLGSEGFDVSEVDLDTLSFGPGGAAPTRARGRPARDVNGDGHPDLVSHFRADEAGIAPGVTEACLAGATRDGVPFEGCDGVVVVGACGLGFELALAFPALRWLRRRRPRGTRAS